MPLTDDSCGCGVLPGTMLLILCGEIISFADFTVSFACSYSAVKTFTVSSGDSVTFKDKPTLLPEVLGKDSGLRDPVVKVVLCEGVGLST